MNLFAKQKQTHRFREPIYGYQGREVVGGGEIDWEFGIDTLHTAVFKIKCLSMKKKKRNLEKKLFEKEESFIMQITIF